jgi:NAD(P)-dependent dehydrogenase (short-subunit alcohol dehydrogenase family)
MAVTIVTGGCSGIGAEITASLAGEGTRCVAVDINRPMAPLPAVDYIQADISSLEGIDALVVGLADLSVGHVDALVHCAAVTCYAPFRSTDRATWERVLRINLHGTIAITQAVVPLMGRGGRIVLFASGTVFKGPRNLSAYVASKAGVIGFARCLAEELGEDNITVNVVSPGITATPMMTPLAHTEQANIAGRALKRREHPADLVGPVRFLLSPEAAFITGQTLCVDGGSVKR